MRNKCLTGLFIVLSHFLVAQPFGNEWINFNQRYFKIKIAEDGVYRIDSLALAQAGMPVGSIAASNIKIYRRGQEIAVNRVASSGFLDYLEFFGKANDGTGDTPLYTDPADQLHPYYSLFSDSASYFITWNQTESGKSFGPPLSLGDNQGNPAEPFHLNELIRLQTNVYSQGLKFGFNSELSSGEYVEGEGWTGNFFTKNQSQTFDFDLGLIDNTGPNPKLEIGLIGGNSLTHITRISAGPSTASLRAIDTVQFESWNQTVFSGEILWTDIAPDGSLSIRVTALGEPGQADRISVAYIKIVAPQEFEMAPDENKVLYQRTSAQSRSYVVVPTTNAAGTRVFEITDPLAPRIITKSLTASDRFEFIVDNPSIPRRFYAFTETKSVGAIEEVNMDRIDPTNSNYLMISHSRFRTPASDGLDPLTAYVNYRESSQGGNFQVTLAMIEEIFNQYGYGDPTPLAIRNFVAHALTVGSPDHLFMVGKGLSTNFGFYRRDPGTTTLVNYVPAFGFPGSDLLFTIKAIGTGPDPALGVGRLNAFSSEDVKSYLDKVKEMEALPFNQLWRKNQILLSGGQNSFEQQVFSNYVEDFQRFAEGLFLGGDARIRRKITTAPTEPIDIRTEINNGLNMVTLFGHSSSQNSDIEIGNVEDHKNAGKYPIILVNGCNAGEIFSAASSFGEPWVNAPQKGALGFVAHADFSFSNNLKRFSDLFYQEAFTKEEEFGRSLGAILTSVATRYFDLFGTNPTNLAQVNLMTVLGDPAIEVFGADQPDFEADPNQTFAEPVSGSQILASQSGFTLNLVVKNYGKSLLDSVEIEIQRTLPGGEIMITRVNAPGISYQDTLQFFIENDPSLKVDGNNQFTFTIDPDNTIDELNESNNQSTFELFITSGSTINIYPIDFGVQSGRQVTFLFQPSEPGPEINNFTLEYDTLTDFSSGFKKSVSLSGSSVFQYVEDFSEVPDSTTIFWRTRLTDPVEDDDTLWVNTSFSILDGVSSGWGQAHTEQFTGNITSGISLDTSTGAWSFLESTNDFQISTHGKDHPNEYEDYQVVVGNVNYMITENLFDPVCRVNTINAVFIDRATGQPYRPISFQFGDVSNPLICGRVPQMIHNLTSNDVLGSNRYLDSLISLMKPDDYVILFSFDSVGYSAWDAQLISSLNEVGIQSSTISSLVDGQASIFLGRKGAAPGEAIELINDGSVLPPVEQQLTLSGEVTYKSTSGTITTRRIGPARTWSDIFYSVEDNENDNFNLDIIGIDQNGVETSLFSNARLSSNDISAVDASVYPFIKLNISFNDLVDLDPPQIKALVVDYTLPPEGLLLAESPELQELQEGQDFSSAYRFINISTEDFIDSLQVTASLLNINNSQVYNQTFNIGAPQSGDTTHFNVDYSTIGRIGDNNLSIEINPNENELLSVNNFLNLSPAATVNRDETNPVLNVTIDGNFILDGDIVSPNPNIYITLKDGNPYLLNQDTLGVEVFLKRPCEGCQFERVNYTDPSITYTPESEGQDFEMNYHPGPLEDGIYNLRVTAEDESGNSSGENDFEISFEVINESTITHFYPYPNPFSTNTRFVFTLTGGIIPDEIKIQIMTITGRVVKEINHEEIGPIRIGNNITEYAWDGRDEYGDLLANGVYLYRVFVRQQGQSLSHRFTVADKSFKNGYGKIYILR